MTKAVASGSPCVRTSANSSRSGGGRPRNSGTQPAIGSNPTCYVLWTRSGSAADRQDGWRTGGPGAGSTVRSGSIGRRSALLGQFGKERGPPFLECRDLGPELLQLAVDALQLGPRLLFPEVPLTMSGADQFLDLVIISQGGCGQPAFAPLPATAAGQLLVDRPARCRLGRTAGRDRRHTRPSGRGRARWDLGLQRAVCRVRRLVHRGRAE